MKGTLSCENGKWLVHYVNNEGSTIFLEVRPNRINELASVGTVLKEGDEIEFETQLMENFPYQYAMPIVNVEYRTTSGPYVTSSIPQKPKPIKKQKFSLIVIGSHYAHDKEIICDEYSTGDNGQIWHFWNRKEGGGRDYVAHYPTSCTCIEEIEIVEIYES